MTKQNNNVFAILKKPVFGLICVFSSALLLGGCSTTPKELETLDETLQSYERAIRWGNYPLAVAFQEKPKNLPDWERHALKNIRVTSYRVISQEVDPEMTEAKILVDIRYYFDNSAIERVLTDRQVWIYKENQEKWLLTTAFPKFKYR